MLKTLPWLVACVLVESSYACVTGGMTKKYFGDSPTSYNNYLEIENHCNAGVSLHYICSNGEEMDYGYIGPCDKKMVSPIGICGTSLARREQIHFIELGSKNFKGMCGEEEIVESGSDVISDLISASRSHNDSNITQKLESTSTNKNHSSVSDNFWGGISNVIENNPSIALKNSRERSLKEASKDSYKIHDEAWKEIEGLERNECVDGRRMIDPNLIGIADRYEKC